MRVLLTLFFGLIVGTNGSFGLASATFQSDDYYKIQVIVDDNVINEKPKKSVKIKGKADRYVLKIKVFDEAGCLVYTHEDRFFASSGFHSDFMLSVKPENCSELRRVKVSRIYSEGIRRPDDFYNKQYITMGNFSDQPFLVV